MVTFIAFSPAALELSGRTFSDSDHALRFLAKETHTDSLKLTKGQIFTKDGCIMGAFVDPGHFRELETTAQESSKAKRGR